MTTQLTHFYFEPQLSIRVVLLNGDPWFIAKDVCDAIELTNSRKAVAALDADERGGNFK